MMKLPLWRTYLVLAAARRVIQCTAAFGARDNIDLMRPNMKYGALCILLLAATAAMLSTSIANTAPPARMSETSVAVSQFAASHQRIKAKLTAEDREILDQLTAKVRKSLPRNAKVPGDIVRILTASTHGLSQDEIEALGTYVSGEISGENSLMQATQQMQETQMSFNLQYLQLQSQMQSENRSYTMVSNIMKTKHDTVKNTISNVH
jgi:hypothetical protein